MTDDGRRLQAYIDESYTDGSTFVMAGYVASKDDWAKFSREWAELLTLGAPTYRTISEFHMSKMTDSPLAIEQSELFYRVIERHLDIQIGCVMLFEDVKAAYDSVEWPDWVMNHESQGNEYFRAFDSIIRGLAVHQHRLGINEPVDFIFDQHSKSAKCLRAWRMLKRIGHRNVTRQLGGEPTFMNSATTLPLQAADLLAYWVRQSFIDSPDNAVKVKFPWERHKLIPGLMFLLTREKMIKNLQNAILALVLIKAGVPREAVGYIVTAKADVVEV